MNEASPRSDGSARTAIDRAIDEAESLAANGDPIAAITLLTAANRVAPDRELETLLVRIRHDGFDARDDAPPATVPPLVRAAASVPPTLAEITPGELSVDSIRTYLSRQGCVLVRGLFDPARSAELADGIERTLDAFDRAAAGPGAEPTPWFVPFTPKPGRYRAVRRNWVRASGGVWTADSPRMLFALLDAVEQNGVGELITQFLGERPVLAANKCTLRRVPITRNGDWHQDGAFLGTEVRSLNMWLSLSDCGQDAPGLDILPCRLDELAPTGTEGANFDWAVSPAVVDEIARARGTSVVRPEFAPGDALLFDHMFLHRTAIDPEMMRERYAIETWFFAPSAYPADQVPLLY